MRLRCRYESLNVPSVDGLDFEAENTTERLCAVIESGELSRMINLFPF